jgi:uncharacterized membrane protein YgcG
MKIAIAILAGVPLLAQGQSAPSPLQLQPLSPAQLDNLVAPVALYPDAVLSQVLAASTYPLELVDAGQWLQQNQDLEGPDLVNAARRQNWDASIQALVIFPDVVYRLTSNIRWTTDLGNAFLAQPADVMNTVQRMRARARAAGKLNPTTELTIATDTEGGQTAIEIQPTDPDILYVPDYNPEDVWGPPDSGYYPPLDYSDCGYGFDFGPGVDVGIYFNGLEWGGWGWGPNWFSRTIYENVSFFNHYGFHGFHRRVLGGRGAWLHDPVHRSGVASTIGHARLSPNGAVASISRANQAGNRTVVNRGNVAVRSAPPVRSAPARSPSSGGVRSGGVRGGGSFHGSGGGGGGSHGGGRR